MQHGAVVPSSRLRCLDREQDAPLGIDGEVRLRGGGKLARRRQARVVPRLAAEDESERRESGGRGGEQREPGQRRPPSPSTPPCRRVGRSPRLGQERALAGSEGKVGRPRPGLELGQPSLARQVLRIATRVVPLPDGLDETPVEEEVLATLFDPPAEPVPLGQDRLVRDLDGRRRASVARGRR